MRIERCHNSLVGASGWRAGGWSTTIDGAIAFSFSFAFSFPIPISISVPVTFSFTVTR